MPNRKELASLHNLGTTANNTWLNANGFSNVQNLYYWSSTTRADNTWAWQVSMGGGSITDAAKTSSRPVLPVRAGQ